jgi:hypothetical protein
MVEEWAMPVEVVANRVDPQDEDFDRDNSEIDNDRSFSNDSNHGVDSDGDASGDKSNESSDSDDNNGAAADMKLLDKLSADRKRLTKEMKKNEAKMSKCHIRLGLNNEM